METKFKASTEIPLLVFSLVPLVITLALWNSLPDQIPIHYNLNGEVDGYGSKIIAPLFNIGLYLFLFAIMFIDPKKENYQKFRSVYIKIRWVLSAFFVAITSIILFTAKGYDTNFNLVMLISITLLFTLLGNFMINIKPNWFIGVRTPWTLSSENVWRKTHRLTGLMWFWGGLGCFIAAFFVDPFYSYRILFSVVVGTSVVSILYSYLASVKEKSGDKS